MIPVNHFGEWLSFFIRTTTVRSCYYRELPTHIKPHPSALWIAVQTQPALSEGRALTALQVQRVAVLFVTAHICGGFSEYSLQSPADDQCQQGPAYGRSSTVWCLSWVATRSSRKGNNLHLRGKEGSSTPTLTNISVSVIAVPSFLNNAPSFTQETPES